MRFDADALGLSPTGTLLLRDLIHDRVGLHYDDARCNLLMDKLAPLVIDRGFDSFLDYYYLLRYDPSANGEWGKVIDALAVPETYFWREVDQIHAIVDVVVPELVTRTPGALRIWSVPCSTGEEPLTIAIALEEKKWFDRANIEIYGGDASQAAIEKARRGRYRRHSFRALPEALRDRYFTSDGDTWVVNPGLHERVRWQTVNVMDPAQLTLLAVSPIVFCRNLFIYFSEQSLARVVRVFDEMMPTPGYLCLGASESLLRYTTRFELEEIAGAYVYVKK